MNTERFFADRKCRINPLTGKAIVVGKPTNIRLHKAAGTYTPDMDAKKPKVVKAKPAKSPKPAKAKSPVKAKAPKTASASSSERPSPTASPKPSPKPLNKFAPLKRRS